MVAPNDEGRDVMKGRDASGDDEVARQLDRPNRRRGGRGATAQAEAGAVGGLVP